MTATEPHVSRQITTGNLIAGIGSAWLLYLIGYFAFLYAGDPKSLGILTTSVQVGLDLVASVTAAWLSRVHAGWRRLALRLLAVATLGLAITDFFWGETKNIVGEMASSGYADVTLRIAFLVSVLSWLGFWGLILLRQTARNISVPGAATLAALAAVSITAFVAAYLRLLSVQTPGHVHVFVLVYASLELVALVVCLGAAILKTDGFPTFLAAGFVLIVASDFVFNTKELTHTLGQNEWVEIPWTLAEACIVAGVLAIHADTRRSDSEPPERADERELYAHNMTPILLFAGIFAASVLCAYALLQATEIRIFAILLIIGFAVICANRFALVHGEAVLRTIGNLISDDADSRYEPALRVFGSYRPIMTMRARLGRVLSSSLRVGDGFAFRTKDTWQAPRPRSMFFIMPYEKEWSDRVHRAVDECASKAGWQLNRADHRFTEQDLLLNIWVEMCRSEIVLADITGHTPNVLYEIGMAHTLGKSIVLLIQEGEPIPFDLSVQRTVFYQPHSKGMRALRAVVRRLLADVDSERLSRAGNSPPDET